MMSTSRMGTNGAGPTPDATRATRGEAGVPPFPRFLRTQNPETAFHCSVFFRQPRTLFLPEGTASWLRDKCPGVLWYRPPLLLLAPVGWTIRRACVLRSAISLRGFLERSGAFR